MAGKLKQIDCSPECGFMVRSHDEKEVMEAGMKHVKNTHGMKVTESDMRAKIKTV